MGALTFKPQAYQSRPWELTSVEVPNYLSDEPTKLTFFFRGQSLLKITSKGWLQDRIRFSYDGFRRQRLVVPLYQQQPINWSLAYSLWFNLIYQHKVKLVVDSFQVYSSWLKLLINRLTLTSDYSSFVYSIDSNVYSTIYQGSHGLETCQTSLLVLPVDLPYEELEITTSLKGVKSFQKFTFTLAQLFLSPVKNYRINLQVYPIIFNLAITNRIACFQVSPIQRFLSP